MTEKASALTFLKEIYKWFSSRKMQPPLPPPLFSHKNVSSFILSYKV